MYIWWSRYLNASFACDLGLDFTVFAFTWALMEEFEVERLVYKRSGSLAWVRVDISRTVSMNLLILVNKEPNLQSSPR